MGSGGKNILRFQDLANMSHSHHHHHHGYHHDHGYHHHDDCDQIPKGCIGIRVGQGEEQQRFVIPVVYVNHPLFMQLLKEAEEEYGFDHNGPITIPCHVEEFQHVQGMIDKENLHPHHHHQHHHSQQHNHHHHFLCFKA